jgi:hypothetical protein
MAQSNVIASEAIQERHMPGRCFATWTPAALKRLAMTIEGMA